MFCFVFDKLYFIGFIDLMKFKFIEDKIRSEEDIVGFLFNQAINAGGSDNIREFWLDVVGLRGLSWQFPKNISEVLKYFKEGFNGNDWIYENTRYRLYKPFLTASESEKLFKYYLGVENYLPTGMHTKHRLKGRRAVCPECIKEDSRAGYAFWHRAHFAPGIVACAVHESLLFDLCESCANTSSRGLHAWNPNLRCECGGQRRPIRRPNAKEFELEVGFSKKVDELLNDEVPFDIHDWSIPVAIRRYIGGGGIGLMARELTDILKCALGERMFGDLNFGRDTVARLVGGKIGTPRLKNPIQNIAVVHAVFGTWDRMAEYVGKSNFNIHDSDSEKKGGTELFSIENPVRRTEYVKYFEQLSEDAAGELIKVHRSWLTHVCELHPKITMTALQFIPGAAPMLRHMYHVDKNYLDSVIESRRDYSVKMNEGMLESRIKFEISEIFRRRDMSIKANPLKRVKISHLMKGGKRIRISEIANSKEVRDAYNECIDSEKSYISRVASHMAVRAKRHRPKSIYADESTWSGLSSSNLLFRIRLIKSWERESEQ